FLDTMRERLQEFALSLHPEKTRLMEFGRLAAANRKRRGLGKPETFTFLGFTFICSKTRRGIFQIKRKSRRDRMRIKLQAIKQELRRSMHQPIPQQGRWLQQVVTGYFNYHAVPFDTDRVPIPRYQSLAAHATAAEPERLDDLGATLDTQGGSRMPELGPYGSVRGARGNSRPYRESGRPNVKW